MKRNLKTLFAIIIIVYTIMLISVWAMILGRRHNSSHFEERLRLFTTDTISKTKVLFLGNSITEGYNIDSFYNKKEYVNRGISGDMTSGILYRIEELISRQPDTIVMMIGVNDISRGIAVDSVINNYRKIFDIFKKRLPNTKIFVLSLLPVRDNFRFKRLLINTLYRILLSDLLI